MLRDVGYVYPKHYTVGCDLGQAQDPTALVVVETEVTKRCYYTEWSDVLQQAVARVEHRVRHAERLPLGMAYPEQVAHVRHVMGAPELRGKDVELVIDMTGVGRPVYEMFERDGLKPIGVVITAGLDETIGEHRDYRVPKILLVSRLQAALHAGELKFAAGLAEEGAFRQELSEFRMRHTEAGRMVFGAREGRHDDLVLALAIGLWRAQWRSRGPEVQQQRLLGV